MATSGTNSVALLPPTRVRKPSARLRDAQEMEEENVKDASSNGSKSHKRSPPPLTTSSRPHGSRKTSQVNVGPNRRWNALYILTHRETAAPEFVGVSPNTLEYGVVWEGDYLLTYEVRS